MNHDLITKELRKDIGEALWQLRRDKKLRLSTVARAVNYHERQIDLLEMGRKFDYSLLRKLAKYYNVNMKIKFE